MSSNHYVVLSQRDQIRLRPGQHIGDIQTRKRTLYVAESRNVDGVIEDRIVEREVEINNALIHIFREVLDNAADNVPRSKKAKVPVTEIRVKVSDGNAITVWNDGLHIPIRRHKFHDNELQLDGDPYEAEIIFGHLNSSSNYNDTDREGLGLHGVGVKLTNIFSQRFMVETYDPIQKLVFKQNYYDGMESCDEPVVKEDDRGETGYTKIVYRADFERFGLDGYSDDHRNVIKRLCIDCAVNTGVKVVYNDTTFNIETLEDYARYYTTKDIATFKSKNSEVVVCERPATAHAFTHISFVNGGHTRFGGIHVETWKKAIMKPLLEKLKHKFGSKSSPLKLTQKSLADYFMIFLKCQLPNPHFGGQTKSELLSPAPLVYVPESRLSPMMQWGFISEVELTMKLQNFKDLKKTDGKKTVSVTIEGADDANKAGGADSSKCVCFLTEGESAKTFAIKGFASLPGGRDFNGALALTGKILNVRGMSVEQINASKGITRIKKILGLQHGLDYSKDSNFQKLRYGQVCILTDADVDGTHIKALLINFFKTFYPTLIARGFVRWLRTPIVRVKHNRRQLEFYYMKDFENWEKSIENENPKYDAMYFKGLGTSEDSEISETFENPLYSECVDDDNAESWIDLVFNKLRSNDRKEWMANFEDHDFQYEIHDGIEAVPISGFVNNELIDFSKYDTERSVPLVVDGFKPSQRKVLWSGRKIFGSANRDLKVAQFASKAAELSHYHHGEKSLEGTIIGMAQSFVGANNVPLFYERGQFGTRILGGKDHAASRYIFTRLTPLTEKLFRKEDDPLLPRQEDEGAEIEPKFFVPVLPTLLLNGSVGIGTGWSTHVPMYNPSDLKAWIEVYLQHGGEVDSFEDFPELVPWYHGFRGETVKSGDSVTHHGIFGMPDDNTYEITELPVGIWTSTYKSYLEKLRDAKKISSLRDNSGAYEINFRVKARTNLSKQQLKMKSTESLKNLVAFTTKGTPKRYDSVNEIMQSFCYTRLRFYKLRKKYLIRILKEKNLELESKVRFLLEALKDFSILKQTEEELFEYFAANDYYKKDGSFEYLTGMPIRSFNTDKLEKLRGDVRKNLKEIDQLEKTSVSAMWLQEIDEFLSVYDRWKVEQQKRREPKKSKKRTTRKKQQQ